MTTVLSELLIVAEDLSTPPKKTDTNWQGALAPVEVLRRGVRLPNGKQIVEYRPLFANTARFSVIIATPRFSMNALLMYSIGTTGDVVNLVFAGTRENLYHCSQQVLGGQAVRVDRYENLQRTVVSVFFPKGQQGVRNTVNGQSGYESQQEAMEAAKKLNTAVLSMIGPAVNDLQNILDMTITPHSSFTPLPPADIEEEV